MTQHRFFRPVIMCIGVVLVLLGLIWVFGGYGEVDFTAGWALTLGIGVTMAIGVGLMAVIFYGRRSRRDEAVHRATGDDDYE